MTKTTDLVKRLEAIAVLDLRTAISAHILDTATEAANEIERLRSDKRKPVRHTKVMEMKK